MPIDNLQIRTEQPGDFPAITSLLNAAFKQDEEDTLVTNLRKGPNYIKDLTFVAVLDGEIVGHLMFTYGHLAVLDEKADDTQKDKEEKVLILAPLAVLPSYQKRGIGKALIRHALQVIQSYDVPLISLEGHPSYYPLLGFEPAYPYGLVPPVPVKIREAFQVYWLSERRVKGQITYDAAFDPFLGSGPPST